MTDYAVVTEGLTRRFGKLVAVDHLDLHVRTGELYGFLGPNGAGKSTTLRMLCGILEPTEGQGSVLGIDLIREPERVKSAIGYMSQKFRRDTGSTPAVGSSRKSRRGPWTRAHARASRWR